MADLGQIGFAPCDMRTRAGDTIEGTVLDDNGQACQRDVYLMSRPGDYTQDIVQEAKTTSNASTGKYTFPVPGSDMPGYIQYRMVVVLDDATGTQYNALILDKISPA